MNHQQHQQFLQRMTMQQQQQQMIIAATRNQSQSSSSTTPGTFQYISQDELLSLYEQRKGAQYFIPEGFEPVLIPRDTSIPPINDNNNNIDNNDNNNNRLPLLQQQQKIKKVIGKNNNKINNNNVNMTMRDIAVSNNSSSTNTTTKTINNNKQSPINSSASSSPSLSSSATTSTSSDVRFPKLVLSRTTATQQTPRAGAAANNNNNSNNNNNNSKPIKQKKPPRPPNAFIIYRRFKQPDIVAKNEGITNNEVSKQVGEMWHREPMEEKLRFQRMADDAKMEHMKKYPEYKYRPRRPHEKRRRTKRPQTSSNGVVNNNNNNADVVADSSSTTDSNNNNINNNNNTNNNNELLIFQPHLHNDHNDIDRRASIDTVSTTETCLDYFGADESRRGSIISLNDFDYGNDFDPLFNDDSHGLLAEEQLTTITSSSSSPSPDLHFNVLSNPGNNICVGSNNNSFNTDALDFLMENVNTPDFSKPDFQFDFFINNFTTTTTTNNNNNNNNNPNDTFDFFDLSGFNLNDSLLMPCDQSIHGDII